MEARAGIMRVCVGANNYSPKSIMSPTMRNNYELRITRGVAIMARVGARFIAPN
jgi:hypothetical protein